MNERKVSIIIPCYNRDMYIEETLNSVRKINYTHWECIVVDSGSTDNSKAIISRFVENDPRFRLHTLSESNISLSRNEAIRRADGEFILPLDSDDLIHPNYVPEAVALLTADPSLTVVTCHLRYFGLRNRNYKTPPYNFESFLIDNTLHNTSFFRRADFDKTPGYDPALKTCEDWEFWITLLKDNGKVHNIDKTYFFYRQHAGSTFRKYEKNNQMNEAYQYIYRKHQSLYAKHLSNPILLLKQHRKYKKEYNALRKLTLRKPLKD